MREERPELVQVMETATRAATAMLKRPTVTALLQVARNDDTGEDWHRLGGSGGDDDGCIIKEEVWSCW